MESLRKMAVPSAVTELAKNQDKSIPVVQPL